MAEIDTGDHVRHEPSGEEWLVAYATGDRLVCCGWPESMALLRDCTLTKKADAKDRDELLMRMAEMTGEDSRARYARRRLAEQAEQEAFRA